MSLTFVEIVTYDQTDRKYLDTTKLIERLIVSYDQTDGIYLIKNIQLF